MSSYASRKKVDKTIYYLIKHIWLRLVWFGNLVFIEGVKLKIMAKLQTSLLYDIKEAFRKAQIAEILLLSMKEKLLKLYLKQLLKRK